MRRKLFMLGAFSLVVAVVGAALGVVAGSEARTSISPPKRTIHLSAVEWKGTTNVSKEPCPTTALPTGQPGEKNGYERVVPDASGNWIAQTYRFDSEFVAAYEGERVILKIFGVNGAEHKIKTEGLHPDFFVRRGRLTTISFIAPEPGIYEIHCHTHMPSMTLNLLVLPRPGEM
jgi:hypothetical protein